MRLSRVFIAGALLAASPAVAATCPQPYAPQIEINAKASQADLVQARDDVQSFIQASDVYQQCLIDATRRDATFRSKAVELMNANQQQKQHIGDAFNAAAKVFNSAHLTKTSDASN